MGSIAFIILSIFNHCQKEIYRNNKLELESGSLFKEKWENYWFMFISFLSRMTLIAFFVIQIYRGHFIFALALAAGGIVLPVLHTIAFRDKQAATAGLGTIVSPILCGYLIYEMFF